MEKREGECSDTAGREGDTSLSRDEGISMPFLESGERNLSGVPHSRNVSPFQNGPASNLM